LANRDIRLIFVHEQLILKSMGKYANTLKMMGVDGKNALLFEDSLNSIHLCINPTVKKYYQDTILETVVMGKSIREYYTDIIKDANRRATRDTFGNIQTYDTKIDDTFGKSETIALIEILTQRYYQKAILCN